MPLRMPFVEGIDDDPWGDAANIQREQDAQAEQEAQAQQAEQERQAQQEALVQQRQAEIEAQQEAERRLEEQRQQAAEQQAAEAEQQRQQDEESARRADEAFTAFAPPPPVEQYGPPVELAGEDTGYGMSRAEQRRHRIRAREDQQAQAESAAANADYTSPLRLGMEAYGAANEASAFPLGGAEFVRERVRPAVQAAIEPLARRATAPYGQARAVADAAGFDLPDIAKGVSHEIAAQIPATGLELAQTLPVGDMLRGAGRTFRLGAGLLERDAAKEAPAVLYHWTPTKNVASIEETGLRPGSWLATTPEDAIKQARLQNRASMALGFGPVSEGSVIAVPVDPGSIEAAHTTLTRSPAYRATQAITGGEAVPAHLITPQARGPLAIAAQRIRETLDNPAVQELHDMFPSAPGVARGEAGMARGPGTGRGGGGETGAQRRARNQAAGNGPLISDAAARRERFVRGELEHPVEEPLPTGIMQGFDDDFVWDGDALNAKLGFEDDLDNKIVIAKQRRDNVKSDAAFNRADEEVARLETQQRVLADIEAGRPPSAIMDGTVAEIADKPKKYFRKSSYDVAAAEEANRIWIEMYDNGADLVKERGAGVVNHELQPGSGVVRGTKPLSSDPAEQWDIAQGDPRDPDVMLARQKLAVRGISFSGTRPEPRASLELQGQSAVGPPPATTLPGMEGAKPSTTGLPPPESAGPFRGEQGGQQPGMFGADVAPGAQGYQPKIDEMSPNAVERPTASSSDADRVASARRQLEWVKEHPTDDRLSEVGSRYAKVMHPEIDAEELAASPYFTPGDDRPVNRWLTEKGNEVFGASKATGSPGGAGAGAAAASGPELPTAPPTPEQAGGTSSPPALGGKIRQSNGELVDASPDGIKDAVRRVMGRKSGVTINNVQKAAADPEKLLDELTGKLYLSKTRGGKPLFEGITHEEIREAIRNTADDWEIGVTPFGPGGSKRYTAQLRPKDGPDAVAKAVKDATEELGTDPGPLPITRGPGRAKPEVKPAGPGVSEPSEVPHQRGEPVQPGLPRGQNMSAEERDKLFTYRQELRDARAAIIASGLPASESREVSLALEDVEAQIRATRAASAERRAGMAEPPLPQRQGALGEGRAVEGPQPPASTRTLEQQRLERGLEETKGNLEPPSGGEPPKGPRNPEQPGLPGGDRQPLVTFTGLRRALGDVLTILPRAFQTGFDYSYPFRQGALLIRHASFWKAFGKGFRSLFDEEFARGVQRAVEEAPYNPKTLTLTSFEKGANLHQREEDFISRLSNYIPGIKQAQRGATVFINSLRSGTANAFARNMIRQGIDPHNTEFINDLEIYGNYLNRATGRGNLGEFERSVGLLNQVFYGARRNVAMVQVPGYLFNRSARVRVEVWKDFLSFFAVGVGTLKVADLAGADVGLDPNNLADFGKIKVGHTRVDIWGGYQQLARMVYKVGAGQIDKPGDMDAFYKPILGFLGNKLSPQARDVVRTMPQGIREQMLMVDERPGSATSFGDFGPAGNELARHLGPLGFAGLYEAIKSEGAVGVPLGLSGLLGTGTQTYTSTSDARKDQIAGRFVKDADAEKYPLGYRARGEGEQGPAPAYNDLARSDQESVDQTGEVQKARGGPTEYQQKKAELLAPVNERLASLAEQQQAGNLQGGTVPDQLKEIYDDRRGRMAGLTQAYLDEFKDIPKDKFDKALATYYGEDKKFADGSFDFEGTQAAQQKALAKMPAKERAWIEDFLNLQKEKLTPLERDYKDYIAGREKAGYFKDGITQQERSALDKANPDQDVAAWFWKGGVPGKSDQQLQSAEAVEKALARNLPNRAVKLQGLSRPVNETPESVQAFHDSQHIRDVYERNVEANKENERRYLAERNPDYNKPYDSLTPAQKGTITGNIRGELKKSSPQIDAWLAWWGATSAKEYTLSSPEAVAEFAKLKQRYGFSSPKEGYIVKVKQ